MAEEPKPRGGEVSRIFEQPETAISFYSDFAQVVGTENEVVLQFYETILGPPGPSGQVSMARSRLRSTIIVSKRHAANIGSLLLKQADATGPQPPPTPARA